MEIGRIYSDARVPYATAYGMRIGRSAMEV